MTPPKFAVMRLSCIGLCIHASHQLHIDADPYAIYEAHAAWVRYAHVGDADNDKKGTLLGQGVLDYETYLKLVDALDLDAPVVVKYQPTDDAYRQARRFLAAAAAKAGVAVPPPPAGP